MTWGLNQKIDFFLSVRPGFRRVLVILPNAECLALEKNTERKNIQKEDNLFIIALCS
jgi:hypothetical protein